ncbi:hypothetical protein O181_041040 [Austropuccinia psidii MF-1]|uniref:Uncharacterized protein n=1 Tax=Austropuccinia psidii MF-1 TaxID=1389203 RepID=A0A9Q3HGS1_9BASI|nr:hypothetical protein [Austropuccinia psidii MF-1]
MITFQHSFPERLTRSQARAQDVPTPTPRASLDGTPAVPQLRAHLDRGPNLEGGKEAKNIKFIFRKEEDSYGTVVAPSFLGASQGTGVPILAQSNQPVSHQSKPSLLAIMQHMTQCMANLKAASSYEASRPQACRTPSIKEPECFNGTQPFKVKSFIHYCKPIFHNDHANFSEDRKTVFMPLHFPLAGVQNVLSFIFPISPIKTQHTFSIIWNHFNLNSLLYLDTQGKKGLASRILDQFASHPSRIYFLQYLMDITLELDTRYHDSKKENNHLQENKPESSKSGASHPQNSLS